jgi:hypothetical protein
MENAPDECAHPSGRLGGAPFLIVEGNLPKIWEKHKVSGAECE